MSEFWSSKNAAPIQSHHFKVKFGDIEGMAVKSVTMPSMEVSTAEYQVGNQFFKYPGVAKWNDVTITLVDTKETLDQVWQELRAQNFYNAEEAEWSDDGIIKTVKNSYGGPKQLFIFQYKTYARSQVASEAEKSKFQEAAGGVFDFLGVSQPNPNHVIPADYAGGMPYTPMVQQTKQSHNMWTLVNPWIKTVNFGTHEYSSDELITMELVVAYDYAEVMTRTPIEPDNATAKYR